MKVAALLLLFLGLLQLLAPFVDATGSASVSFADASSLTTTGLLTLSSSAPAGSTTTCRISCSTAGTFLLNAQYGSVPSGRWLKEERRLTTCGDGVSITSGSAQSQVGYRLETASAFTGLSLTCSWTPPVVTQPPPGSGDVDVDFIVCFSGDMTVDVLQQGRVPMKDLAVGDQVLDSAGDYTQVYAFGHYLPEQVAPFLVLQTNQSSLEVTGDHLVYLDGKSQPVTAESIRVGDRLAPNGATVTNIRTIQKAGLYAPLTTSGTLLVANTQVSSYAVLGQHSTRNDKVQFADGTSLGISHHIGIHWLLTPYRIWCTRLAHCSLGPAEKEDGMPMYVSAGIRFMQWVNEQPLALQVVLLLAWILVFFAIWVLDKLVFETPYAILIVTVMVWRKYNFKST